MTVRQTTLLALGLCGLLAIADACHQGNNEAPHMQASKVSPHKFSHQGSVREMSIAPEDMQFPQGEGKAEFEMYCGICHSLKYVTAQPPFSREVWAAEVHKMAEKFGAPVDSANAEKITNYLVTINGIKP
ncbi:MAG: hypothetical protein KF744_01465 [Taibaiella sp.]|nr:hypothetical protein [Taibaiella sp.]